MRPLQHSPVVVDQRVDRAITSHVASRLGFTAIGAGGIAAARSLFEQGAHFEFAVLNLTLLEVLPVLARYDRAGLAAYDLALMDVMMPQSGSRQRPQHGRNGPEWRRYSTGDARQRAAADGPRAQREQIEAEIRAIEHELNDAPHRLASSHPDV